MDDDLPCRASLLAAVLTGQAVLSLGAFIVVLAGGLDALLFLAPVSWGLGFLVTKEGALGLAALLYLAGTGLLAFAAHAVRTGRDATRWTFLAAGVCLIQLPAGVATAAYCLWLGRRADYRDAVDAAPVLAGRALRRLVALWLLAGSATVVVGALGVALLFGATAPVGLFLVLAAPGAQGAMLVGLDRRVRHDAVLPAMPGLPDYERPAEDARADAPDWTNDL